MYVWCVCVHVCVLRMCAYADLCATCVCVVCICVQKRKRQNITCFEVCVLTHHSVRMHNVWGAYAHVWGVHVYICSAETSLSS